MRAGRFALACAAGFLFLVSATATRAAEPFRIVDDAATGGRADVHSAAAKNYPIDVVANIGTLDSGRAFLSPDGKVMAVQSESGIKLWDVAGERPLRALDYFAFVTGAQFSPDSKAMVTAHKDGSIRLWDIATGRTTAVIHPGVDPKSGDFVNRSLWLDEKGQLAVSGDGDGNIGIWDIAQRRPIKLIKFAAERERIYAAKLSADGKTLIAAGRRGVKVFDRDSGRALESFALPKDAFFHGYSTQEIMVGEDGFLVDPPHPDCKLPTLVLFSIKDWNDPVTLDKPKSCEKPNENDYSYGDVAAYAAQDGQFLVMLRNGSPTLNLWNVKTRSLERTLTLPAGASPTLLGVSGDLARIIVGDKSRIELRDGTTGAIVHTYRSFGLSAENAIAAAGGHQMFLVHAGRDKPTDKTLVEAWDVTQLNRRRIEFAIKSDALIYDVAPQAKLALAISSENIVLLSTETGRELRRFAVGKIDDVLSAKLSPDGKLIALAKSGDVSEAVVLNAEDGRVKLTIPERKSGDDRDFVTAFVFFDDSKRLAVGWWAGAAEIWDTTRFARIKRLPLAPEGDWIRSMALSADGRVLFAGTRDSGVFMWNVATDKFIRMFERDFIAGHVNISSVAVSRDGTLIAAGQAERARSSGDTGPERSILVWDAATGKQRFKLRGHEGGVRALAFSPNDRWLVSASYDGTIRYWDRNTGRPVATFTAAQDERWMAITEEGFFAGSTGIDDFIAVVRGLDTRSAAQVHDQLYRPDLVNQLIEGDLKHRYDDAVKALNLAKVFGGD